MNIPENQLEPMPEALLVELFSGGIVVIPDEFRAKEPEGVLSQGSGITRASDSPNQGDRKTSIPMAAELTWLGDFAKRVLVVVNDPTALHINETDFELLGKILGAVKLSMKDIALVNAASHQMAYEQLQEKLPAEVAIYFGIEPVDIGAPIKFPQFQVQAWNHTRFLYCPSLEALNRPEAKALKMELWDGLKRIFS